MGRDRIIARARELPFYRWMYSTVIEDLKPLGALYRDRGLLPLRRATDMSAGELRLAALMTEAPISTIGDRSTGAGCAAETRYG